MQGQYLLTHHARLRYVERRDKKYKHLSEHNQIGCASCDRLERELEQEALQKYLLDPEIKDRIKLAKEDRAFTNNSNFMDWYMKKYGYGRFEVLVHESIMFVVSVKPTGHKVVTTCLDKRIHKFGY